MKFKNVYLVEVVCPRCGNVHVARKECCLESKKHPGVYSARVLCSGDECDGMNGEIWKWLHGKEKYVTGKVIPDSYLHPIKRVVPDWSIY